MTLRLPRHVLQRIEAHGEEAYPEEGAGFILGTDGRERVVEDLVVFANARENGARHNRYLMGPDEYLKAELEAERRNLALVGVFHSHPDHPNHPSDYDQEWAQPVLSYVITSVEAGRATESKSWRLLDDRTQFSEEEITLTD